MPVGRQIGRFLDALKTIRVDVKPLSCWSVTTDGTLVKEALVQRSNLGTDHAIPFMIRAAGVKLGSVCMQPVNSLTFSPTLVDLAGLPVPEHLDGSSVKPQLVDPMQKRSPVISSYGDGNTAIRTRRWRYIRYEDGSEELYDHSDDPHEWKNLAESAEHQEVKRELAAEIPKNQHRGLKVQNWFNHYQP